jgi:hypothetical protein
MNGERGNTMLQSLIRKTFGVGGWLSGRVAPRVCIWTLVLLLALNAGQMMITAWLYAESFKLQAEAAELVYLSTVARQLRRQAEVENRN